MASNPMQRKARISFLLGFLVMLIIAGVAIAFLFMQIKNQNKQIQSLNAEKTSVYVLTSDVKAGQEVLPEFCQSKSVTKSGVPANAIGGSQSDLLTSIALQDKEGHEITATSEDGETKLKIVIDDKEYDLNKTIETTVGDTTTSYTYTYEYGEGNNKETRTVDLNEAPLIAMVDLKANTVLTADMLRKGDNAATDDMRIQEYNMISLPTDLESEDFVDIRLALPNGQDFIVLSKKSVTIPDLGGVPSADTIRMELTEMETLYMGNALIDSYLISGSRLYATKYSEAGLQDKATSTYTPNSNIVELIKVNPNIVEQVKQQVGLSTTGNPASLRGIIDGIINSDVTGSENVKTKVDQSISTTQEARQQYLESMGGGTTTP